MLWCNFHLWYRRLSQKKISTHTVLPPHPHPHTHTLPDLPTETLRPLAHTLQSVSGLGYSAEISNAHCAGFPSRLSAVCPHILSVEKGREGAWIQSHSSALSARRRRARRRETHSESRKVPASLSASLPSLYACLPICLGFTPAICPLCPKPRF